MRNRQRRWKRTAVHIQHDLFAGGVARRQMTEKQRQPRMRAGDPMMLLARIELYGARIQIGGVHGDAPCLFDFNVPRSTWHLSYGTSSLDTSAKPEVSRLVAQPFAAATAGFG